MSNPVATPEKEPLIYRKANSFVNLGGNQSDIAAVLERITRLHTELAEREQAAQGHADAVLNARDMLVLRACQDLLSEETPAANGQPLSPPDPSADNRPRFTLQPHIIAEIRRIRDDELSRYLYYRYRYDIFPQSREADAYPPCVQIEPTSICNYRCVFCYQTDLKFTQARHGHMGMMPVELFRTVVEELTGEVEAVTLASRGEPMMAKKIEEMLAHAAGRFLGLKVNTNAWFLTEEKAHALLSAEPNTVVFSADAADADLYSRLRVNGKLDRVLKNIEMFQNIRSQHYSSNRTITRVSGVRFSDQQEFTDIEQFWGKHVDQVAFVDYNPWENAYDSPANGMTTACSDLWRRTFVWWDGRVNPCDVDYRSELSVGKLPEQSVSDLWTSDAYSELRNRHMQGDRQSLMPCKGCALI